MIRSQITPKVMYGSPYSFLRAASISPRGADLFAAIASKRLTGLKWSFFVFGLVGVGAAIEPKNMLPPADLSEIAYGSHERQRLDLWHAKSSNPTPLVIFIHGGGWHGGDKSSVPAKFLDYLLLHGISVASINYRFTSMATLPGPLLDGARAVQFLRKNAGELGLDPTRFAAAGISAGGCTALWIAYHDELADPTSSDPVEQASSRLQAAVGIGAQTSLDPREMTSWVGENVLKHPMLIRALGLKNRAQLTERYAEFASLLRECSPIEHVSRNDPPVMVSYPVRGPLPAPDAGSGIHHAMFGVRLKEKADLAGLLCVLRIDAEAESGSTTPEEFLRSHLARGTN